MRHLLALILLLAIFSFGCTYLLDSDVARCQGLNETGAVTGCSPKSGACDYHHPRTECLIDLALNRSDPGICALARSESAKTGSWGDNCYATLAINRTDAGLCDLISNSYYRDSCHYSVAEEISREQAEEVRLCFKTADPQRCVMDYAWDHHESAICDLLDDNAKRQTCKNQWKTTTTAPIQPRQVIDSSSRIQLIRGSFCGSYIENETINESGITLEFEPPIQILQEKDVIPNFWRGYEYGASAYSDNPYSDRCPLNWIIGGQNWSMIKLRNENGTQKLILGKEITTKYMERDYTTNTIRIGEKYWSYDNDPRSYLGICIFDHQLQLDGPPEPGARCLKEGESTTIDGEIVHFWMQDRRYVFYYWAYLSTFSETYDLAAEQANVTIVWENDTIYKPVRLYPVYGENNTYIYDAFRIENVENPKLRSIFIPRTSPLFERLRGA